MRAQLLHLSGPLRGRTITYQERVVRIGRAATNEVCLQHDKVEPRHAQIEWVQAECKFHLRRLDGQVFVNGTEVEEVILKEGDLLEFGAGGPMARFRIYVPIGAVCKPVRRMLTDAAEVARHSGGVTATRMLTSDLLTKASPSLKLGVPLVVVLVFLAAWGGGWLGSRPSQEERRRTADMVTHEELAAMRAQYQAEIDRLRRGSEVVRTIQKRWSKGVCLIHGIYRLRRPDGSWILRYGGKPYEVEYTGSGFLVTDRGHIVTNRHVALPWTVEPGDMQRIEQGAEPVFVHFTATFPGRLPVDIPQSSIVRRTDDLDVALVRLLPEQVEGVPVLPLRQDGTEGEDQRAIVVGYPTGLAALLARASPATLEQLRKSAATMADAIEQLARAGQIAPTITAGIVSNSEPHLIAYDAATIGGGSGGPVFSERGDVIAVNFAIQRGFDGNNLGVPIRFARELLPK